MPHPRCVKGDRAGRVLTQVRAGKPVPLLLVVRPRYAGAAFYVLGRRHAVGIEHRVDVPQALDAHLERLRVAYLDDEAVLDHRVDRRTACLDDVAPRLGERAREVLEQAVAIPAVDLDLGAECLTGAVALPPDLGEALRVALERLDA